MTTRQEKYPPRSHGLSHDDHEFRDGHGNADAMSSSATDWGPIETRSRRRFLRCARPRSCWSAWSSRWHRNCCPSGPFGSRGGDLGDCQARALSSRLTARPCSRSSMAWDCADFALFLRI